MEIDWPHLQSTIIGNSTSNHEVDKLVSKEGFDQRRCRDNWYGIEEMTE